MKQLQRYGWTLLGFGAVVFSAWLLYGELKGLSLDELWESIVAISPGNWLLCALATLAAYAALAGYDRLALLHLGHRGIGWRYVLATSFTTYALAHNIGASVFSGSVVRYRAYSAKGLSATEVGVLVAFCTFTFSLGVLLLSGIVLLVAPSVAERFFDVLPIQASAATGLLLLGLVLFYLLGSVLRLKPLRIGSFALSYPRLPIVARQLAIGPLEIIGAALIVYFALPEAGNPGFVIVLGIFLVAFSLALLSHAPGGLGVLEIAFITGLPEIDPVDDRAAAQLHHQALDLEAARDSLKAAFDAGIRRMSPTTATKNNSTQNGAVSCSILGPMKIPWCQ